jgi:glucosamine--fructose-6-phosphate aminotransferase (isomerizing)
MIVKSHTWQEIISQPQAWHATLDTFSAHQDNLREFLDQTAFDRMLVIGCGSTYYLSQAAATTLIHRACRSAQACPSSELWLLPRAIPPGHTLLIPVSRSGATTETLYATEKFKDSGAGSVLAITCYPDSPLARQADLALLAPAGQEQSVAQTRSFTSMLLLIQALVATLASDQKMLGRLHRLAAALTALTERVGDLPRHLGTNLDIERIFFLGGGPLYGIACEAMLKTKEMSLSYAEAYHPLEFRHGPMSMVNERTLIVGLLSDVGLAEEIKVLADMQNLGARVLALVDDASVFNGWQPSDIVELDSGLDQWERQPLYLPVLQRLAYHRAVAKGLDPDRPTHLQAVVELSRNPEH